MTVATMDDTIIFDVIIIGGGPAGCATALALLNQGVTKIALIDSGEDTSFKTGESLPPNIRPVLQQLGVWDRFVEDKHEPCLGSCSSWGSDALGYNDFLSNLHGNGWHLNRKKFDGRLLTEVKEKGVSVFEGKYLTSAKNDRHYNNVSLQLKNGRNSVLSTKFMVDASGSKSAFCKQQNIKRNLLDRLTCVYGFFDLSESASASKLTMLEAVEYGWWYAARLPNNKLTVVFASDNDIINKYKLTEPSHWQSHLNQTQFVAKKWVDPDNTFEQQLHVCPASSYCLEKVSGENWIAVGDTGSTYDPITSQGIYKALTNGINAAQAIALSLKGDARSLQYYNDYILHEFIGYVENRNYFYSLENRWPESTFWTRRKSRVATDLPGHKMAI